MSDSLVIQLARIGDIVQTKRLVLSLQRQGTVHLAIDKSMLGLARRLYPGAVVHGLCAHRGEANPSLVLAENSAAFAELAACDFEYIYNLNRSPLSLALAGLFAQEQVQGYRMVGGESASSNWCRMAANWTRNRRSSPLNIEDFWAYFCTNPIAPAKVNPRVNLNTVHEKPGRKRIGIVLSGRESRRSLPPPVLAQCMEALFISFKGPEFILIGGKGDTETGRKLIRKLRPASARQVVDLSGKTSLTDLFDVLSGLDLVFTPDTGAMHIAAHLGIPVMATFLSSAWAQETGPYGEGHRVWQASEACAPCLESAPCKHDKLRCLEAFQTNSFLSMFAKGVDEQNQPEGLICLESSLDDLGVQFLTRETIGPRGDSPRDVLRFFIRERLGLVREQEYDFPWDNKLLASLMFERDWTLPDDGGLDLWEQ